MKILVVAISLFLILTSICYAEDSIPLAGIKIKIGDKKADILPNLEKYYRLKEAQDDPGVFTLFDKEGSNNEGMIQFVNDKVAVVNKEWGSFNKTEGLEILKALIGAISSLSGEENIAHVSIHRTSDPKVKVENVDFSFGRRKISISLIEYKGNLSIQVHESLF